MRGPLGEEKGRVRDSAFRENAGVERFVELLKEILKLLAKFGAAKRGKHEFGRRVLD